MAWEKYVDGRYVPQPSCPPQRAAQLARELYERHRRENATIRKVLRLARAARRRAWRPAVVHACPTSTPRPRERGARRVAASGRDGIGKRDDGSGDVGSGSDPPPRLGARVLERERGRAS